MAVSDKSVSSLMILMVVFLCIFFHLLQEVKESWPCLHHECTQCVLCFFVVNTTRSQANYERLCWLCCIASLLSEKMKRDAAGVAVVIPPVVRCWEFKAQRQVYNLPFAERLARTSSELKDQSWEFE